MKKTAAILGLLIVFAFSQSVLGADKTGGAKSKGEYLILASLYGAGTGPGFSTADYLVMANQLLEILEKDYGLKFKYDVVGNTDMAQTESQELLAKE